MDFSKRVGLIFKQTFGGTVIILIDEPAISFLHASILRDFVLTVVEIWINELMSNKLLMYPI